jgi:hypothetical protein
MPPVQFSTRLDLEQIILFLDGHVCVPTQEWDWPD